MFEEVQNSKSFMKGGTDMHEIFVIDNTPYPFPEGAEPYSDISLSASTSLTIKFNEQYKVAGIRLIFIIVTLLVIYGFAIGRLVFKARKVQAELLLRSPDYNLNSLKRRGSELSNNNNHIEEEDEYSEIDNYEQIVGNDSLREPSMLESAGDERVLMKMAQQKQNNWFIYLNSNPYTLVCRCRDKLG